MDNPGISLFNGNELNLSGVKQNDEDEEFLKEQKRLDEEVCIKILMYK